MYAVILAGGSGTRLWPWSREQYPKQLLNIKEKSLFQNTVLRLNSLIPYQNIIIVTHHSQKASLEMQLNEISGGHKAMFIDEPMARNTAPAIGLAAFYLYKKDPEAVMAVLPSDHHIELIDEYQKVLLKAEQAAEKYGLVTFGIVPDRPETGFGYICCGEKLNQDALNVERFVEKPNIQRAREFIKDRRFLWNSGMFIFKVKDLVKEYEKYLPAITGHLKEVDYDTFANLPQIYAEIEGVSIDYGIMEKTSRVVVVPADINWSDVGNWDALYNMLPKDEDGNHIKGSIHNFATRDSLLLGSKRVVGAIGLDRIVLVDTEDALLVCSRDNVQDVKKVVDKLKDNNSEEYKVHKTVYRPWGSYTVLEEGTSYKIKRVVVEPGRRLSLQYHNRRSEHWVVVTGQARVTVGENVLDLMKNQSAYVPPRELHRLENPGSVPLEVIEVQNGSYLGEDDIVRVDDDFNRLKEETAGPSVIDAGPAAYKEWLQSPCVDSAEKEELKAVTDPAELRDMFARELEFGTGGFRGVLGLGTNRMNKYVIRRATQGLANHIKNNRGSSTPAVAIAYDSRYKSREFAEEAALVLAGNGIKAYLFEGIRSTPQLSFTVRKLKCSAGIVITASHNPPQYNGYKVYGEDGGQAVPSLADKIASEIAKVHIFNDVKCKNKSDALAEGLLNYIGEELDADYLNQVMFLSMFKGPKDHLKVVFTPLHGTGNMPVRRVLKGLGFENVHVVNEQVTPDPAFSTVESPNPEDERAFSAAITIAERVNADIILGTDPDCDRVGCAAKGPGGKYVLLTGNQTGALLLDYLLGRLKENNSLPPDGVLIKTIVTSNLGREIASHYGVDTIETLTGFKYIGEKIKDFEEKGDRQFLFGYEESYGYLAGTFVRDKDAVIASMLITEMAAYYKEKGLTLYQALIKLYERHGFFKEALVSISMPGEKGLSQVQEIMDYFRNDRYSPQLKQMITQKEDYKTGKGYDLTHNKTYPLSLPPSQVLLFKLQDDSWFCIRPSGTEPKIKFYFSVKESSDLQADRKLDELKNLVLGKTSLLKSQEGLGLV